MFIFYLFFFFKDQWRSISIAGRVSYVDFFGKNITESSSLCFEHDRSYIERGVYTIWKCVQPNPIGRNAALYLRDPECLQVYEFIVIGKKINDINFEELSISGYNQSLLSSLNGYDTNSFLDKISDKHLTNYNNPLKSCSYFKTNLDNKLNIYLQSQSIVYQVGLLFYRESGKKILFFFIFIFSILLNIHFYIRTDYVINIAVDILFDGMNSNCFQMNGIRILTKDYIIQNCTQPYLANYLSISGSSPTSDIKICEIFIFGYSTLSISK